MISFFRKIRQRLLSENKFSKYLIYAVGEIVLIVIGILIALQINNWNENRKTQSRSLDYMQRLKVDLDHVLEDINNTITDTDQKYNQALLVLEVLESKELLSAQQEDFETYFKRFYQFPITIQSTTAYNEMLSTGDLGLIKNESLRTAFANLSVARAFIMEVNQSNHDAYINNMELIEKYIRYHVQKGSADSTTVNVTYDFDSMANDELFINRISNQMYTWRNILHMYKFYQREVKTVRDSVLEELSKF